MQDADCCGNVIDSDSVLETDNPADKAQNINFSWYGLVESDAVPVLRTIERLRPSQRTYDKRKLFTFSTLIISSTTNTFKHLAQKRLLLCHFNNLGGTLLHYLCKLSL